MTVKNKLLYWRTVFSLSFALLVNLFLGNGFKYVPLLAIIGFIASFVLFENKHIQQASDLMLDSKFDKVANFFYKCLVVNVGMSMFSTLVVLTAYYNNRPDYSTTVMFYSFFVFYCLLVFALKKLSVKIPFCDNGQE